MYREKVIDNLLIIRTWNEVGKAYAYDEMDKKEKAKTVEWIDDALKLLKEQETEDTGSCRVFQCKKCGFGIDDIFVNDEEKYQILPRYCPNCGRSVKWNE